MFNLEYKLRRLEEILEDSNEKLDFDEKNNSFKNYSGFEPMHPYKLKNAAIDLYFLNIKNKVSMNLGCGNGGWALFVATLGYESYGIDINEYLINEANKNLDIAKKEGIIKKILFADLK